MQKTIWAFLGMLVLAMTLLVACGEDDDAPRDLTAGSGGAATQSESFAGDPDATSRDDAATDGGGAFGAVAPPGQPAPGNTGVSESPADQAAGGDEGEAGQVTAQQLTDGRVIIYTSWMVVEVEDVSLATQQAQTAMAGLGGMLFGQETTTEPYARTVLIFKVSPDDFQEALRRLEELGKLESQQVSTDDVTERVVDLESRITTAEASVERLRAFLASATDLEGVAQIEAQLLQRETDLELLRGQLRTIQSQAALATIYVTLTEPQPEEPEAAVELGQTAYLGHDDGDRCPGDDELEVDENDEVTVCFAIENTGNLALTEIEVSDGGLDLDEEDFVVLEGSLEGPLEPGELLVGYFETDAEFGSYASPRFSAVAVDEDGDTVRIGISVDEEPVELDVNEDTSVPSFVDGLSNSFGALISLGLIAILAVGVAIPFLWVPLLVVGLWILGRRMAANRTRRPASMATTAAAPGDEAARSDTSSDD
jgi:hypothetical protein